MVGFDQDKKVERVTAEPESPSDITEGIYLGVYGEMAENSAYFQPRTGTDFLTPEIVIASLTSSVIFAFVQGFFSKMGEKAAVAINERKFGRDGIHGVESKVLLDQLTQILPQLISDDAALEHARQSVEVELVRLELAPEVALKISHQVITIVKSNLQGDRNN